MGGGSWTTKSFANYVTDTRDYVVYRSGYV